MAWNPGDPFRVKDTVTVRNCGINPVMGQGHVCFVDATRMSFYLDWSGGRWIKAKCDLGTFGANFIPDQVAPKMLGYAERQHFPRCSRLAFSSPRCLANDRGGLERRTFQSNQTERMNKVRCIRRGNESCHLYRELLKSAFNESTDTKEQCNYLVYAVAKKLGIVLPVGKDADGLIDFMSANWYTIPTLEGAELRSHQQFVVAGLKACDHKPPRIHGHVAVVIPRTTQQEHRRLGIVWPYAWSAGVQSQGNLSIGSQIWTLDDAKRVRYFTPTRFGIKTVPPY
jgi:hypothetical protein